MLFNHTILIIADKSRVWNMLTARMHEWLMDKEIAIKTNWMAGNAIQFSGELNGHPFVDKGTILVANLNTELTYTYLSESSNLPDIESSYSIISFHLKNENDGTLLSIKHSNIHDMVAYNHIKFYWPSALHIIKKLAEENS